MKKKPAMVVAMATGIFEEGGDQYPFSVLPWTLEPELPNFVGYNEGALIISETVPKEFRPYVFAHEILCNVIWANEPGRCLRALREELRRVPEADQPRYIGFRLVFYRQLAPYRAARIKDDPLKQEIRAALAWLEELAQNQLS